MNSTVKRKFNALIQGISSRPPTAAAHETDTESNESQAGSDPSSIMASDLGLLTKKRRVEPRTSTPSRYGSLTRDSGTPPSRGPTTISNITLRKWTPNGTVPPPAKDAQPKYCPGDRDQLIKRLASFQELTDWTPKPDPVNEIEWAKRGWVCHGKELVRCILCNRELVVKLNRKEVDGKEVPVLVASEIEDALVQKYVQLIVESHSDDCLWRKHGCDDSLLRLPLAHPKTALAQLRQRYDELSARAASLPYESALRLPASLDLDTVLAQLPPDFFTNPPPPPPSAAAQNPRPTSNPPPPSQNPPPVPSASSTTAPNRPALALALLGWQGLADARLGAVASSAACATCLRRLGLWLFRAKRVDAATGAVLVPAAMDHLDPLREHRFFCPWRNGRVQRGAGGEEGKAGWEVLVEGVRNEGFLRGRLGADGGGRVEGGREVRDGNVEVEEEDVEEEEEDEEARAVKDKERWARLRRVKSLFNGKGGGRSKKAAGSRPGTSGSRPGTGVSTAGGGGS